MVSKLVVLGTFLITKNKKLKICSWIIYTHPIKSTKKSKSFWRTNSLLRKTPILIIETKAFLTWNYHTLVLIQTVPRKKFMSYVKHFAKTPTLKLFVHHSNCRTYFVQETVCQLLWSPLLCTNLLVQDVNLVPWGNQMPFTNKDQGTSANWYKISYYRKLKETMSRKEK